MPELYGNGFDANPYPAYDLLRSTDPVRRVTTPMGFDTYLITRYDEARAALADPRLSKDMRRAGPAYVEIFGEASAALDENMLNLDPPDHTRLRRLVSKAFTPRRIEGLRSQVIETTELLLDSFAPRGEAELMESFAFPLPVTIICDLLGVPAADRAQFTGWARQMGTAGFDGSGAAEQAERALHAYLTSLVAQKRASRGDDLLCAMIDAQDADSRLTDAELISTTFLLLFAGHETTANFLGNALLAIIQDDTLAKRLVERPQDVDAAVEELLRYDGSVENATFRWAAEEVTYAGTVIPVGSMVTVSLNAANRDPARFARPELVDLDRTDTAHLAFGHGMHYCLGAPLARLEARIGIGMLLQRLPNLCLAVKPEELHWLPSVVPFRGLKELPVWFTPEVTHSRRGRWQSMMDSVDA